MKIKPLKLGEVEDFLHENYGIKKEGRKYNSHYGTVVKRGSIDYGFEDFKGRKLGMTWKIHVLSRTWVDHEVVHLDGIELYLPEAMQTANGEGTGGQMWYLSKEWYGSIEECEEWIRKYREKWEKKKREKYLS